MPKDQQKRPTRQQPISCRSCRSRKLRCNREFPCSNCVSRGFTCELDNAVRPSPGHTSSLELELLERIRKLEQLAESHKVNENGLVTPLSSHETPSRQLHKFNELPETVTPESTTPAGNETLNHDIAYLESIYNNDQQLQDNILSNNLIFKNCPIGQITNAPAYINRSATSFEPLRCIWLPQYSEAQILLDKYLQDVDHIHHIVHAPSLSAMLSSAYNCLSAPNSVTKHGGGFIFLFLAIFASATNSWTQIDCDRGLFSTAADANAQAPLWVKALEDVLDVAHRTMGVSMEGIQGVTIAAFVVLSMSGFSRRYKSLFNMALFLARDAGLHVLDHPSNIGSAKLARTELGRRLWWHLVASDWQAPVKFEAAIRGVYHCNPRQMVVKKPLNLNDEDLGDEMSQNQKPLSWPTVMSYPLQRIRVAEIMRSLIDRNALTMSYDDDSSHNAIMEIDTELQLFINEIPPFFSMASTDLETTYQMSPLRAISIVQQGFCLYSLTWSQRCKLHIPYFSRAELDYTASRDICLHSARQVIKTETLLSKSGLFTAIRYKLLGTLASVFMASVVVLLMDINHNKSSPPRKTLSGEILDAIRILEHARHQSETAAKFLDSLMSVVKRHNVCRTAVQNNSAEGGAQVHNNRDTQAAVGSLPPSTPTSILGINNVSYTDTMHEKPESREDLLGFYNGLAQEFEYNVDFEGFDWDMMLSELEPSIV
ncbi:putative transcription factor lepB [Lachnellula suecica]|uniref:Putative transcription factor lepB n=1 Tax=Lachnellula suecica TaxID=602035 RepID=A0A8T9C4W9_9HELO|nr:putative transcription factor lepB [Lachnellula suecica]